MISEEISNQLIQRIELLERIILDQGSLGLSQGRQFIYIQKTKTSAWTFIATDEPVNATSITGYIVDIYRKEDDVPKLHIVIRTRKAEYVLCSGFETHFSRDVMAAIAQLKPQQLKRPLKIVPTVKEPKPGEKQSNHQPVYANVLLDDQTIRTFQLKKDLSAQDLFQRAIAVLKGKTQSNQSKASSALAPQEEGKSQPVDWKVFCRQYGVFPEALKELATELGLPQGKLNPTQSAQLYDAAWKKFVERSA